MQIYDVKKEKVAERKDKCFFCGSIDTETYRWKSSPKVFEIQCNTCYHNSIF